MAARDAHNVGKGNNLTLSDLPSNLLTVTLSHPRFLPPSACRSECHNNYVPAAGERFLVG
jgi:hypothetical protein